MKPMPNTQRGATLLIALVLLLVITLLAVSSTRETALESRITGNFIAQQKQLNYAEAVLREGEELMTVATLKPREPGCAGNFCFYADDAKYDHKYDKCTDDTAGIESKLLASDSYASGVVNPPSKMRWYAITAPSGASEGASENPEYGNMMLGIGTFRYEINGRARNTNTDTCVILRSTTAKVFN